MLVHDRPERHGRGGRRSWLGKRSRPQHDLRGGRDGAEGRARADRVVVPTPALDDDLGLLERGDDLAVEQLVPELGVEALDVAVLPRRAWGDVGPPRHLPDAGASSRWIPGTAMSSTSLKRRTSPSRDSRAARSSSERSRAFWMCAMALATGRPVPSSLGRAMTTMIRPAGENGPASEPPDDWWATS